MPASVSLSFEWHIPDRVYMIHIVGLVNVETAETIAQNILTMLNENGRSRPVHLIFNAAQIQLESHLTMLHLQSWGTQIYRHPFAGSILTVTGLNRLYAFMANSIGALFPRKDYRWQSVRTLNEGLQLLHALDVSLPPMNV
jgi:hypothetical protein